MGTKVTSMVFCDICLRGMSWSGDNKNAVWGNAEMIKIARKRGFKTVNGKFLCPECQKEAVK